MQFTLRWKTGKFKGLWHRTFYQWIKHYKALFTLTFFAIVAVGGFQWYRDLGHYEWTEDQKKEYLDRTITETTFQEEKYRHALEELNLLKNANESEIIPGRDLFLGKKAKRN